MGQRGIFRGSRRVLPVGGAVLLLALTALSVGPSGTAQAQLGPKAPGISRTASKRMVRSEVGPADGLGQAPGSYADGLLYPAASDRFGVAVNRGLGPAETYDVAQIRSGWYVDWGTQLAPVYPAGMDYFQMVTTSGDTFTPDEATLAAIAAANPGMSWIIGNEPDCIWQGNSTPDQYARVYHRLYTFLKAHDPSCRVAIGGIVQATPLRLQWLDAVLSAYQAKYGGPLPADFYNIHAFILREERSAWGCDVPPGLAVSHGELWQVEDHDRMDLFVAQIVRFRQWMRDHGERSKELIVSEYGILMPDDLGFDEGRVQAFMRSTFDYFLTATSPEVGCPTDGNRLVQRWAWYSLNDKRFEGHTTHSHLFDPTTKQITGLGQGYAAYAAPLYSPYVDLEPVALTFSSSAPMSAGSQPVTITIAGVMQNAGNVDAHDVAVQFWTGDPSQRLGEEQIIPLLAARSRQCVTLQWAEVSSGSYLVGVTVDGAGHIAEANEANNEDVRQLLVPRHVLLVPMLAQHR